MKYTDSNYYLKWQLHTYSRMTVQIYTLYKYINVVTAFLFSVSKSQMTCHLKTIRGLGLLQYQFGKISDF